jgi:hypothetical protein
MTHFDNSWMTPAARRVWQQIEDGAVFVIWSDAMGVGACSIEVNGVDVPVKKNVGQQIPVQRMIKISDKPQKFVVRK